MRRMLITAGMLAALATAGHAQRVEIGTQLGATIVNGAGSTEFVAGVPGAGTLFGLFPTIYTTIFATPQLMVEPQVLFLYSSAADAVDVSGVLQFGYRLSGTARGSPFIAVHGGVFKETDQSSETMLGGSFGYHYNLSGGAAVRFEARYRRWIDSDVNDIAALIGFGIRL